MMRIGHGYDVHRLVPERELILGGIKIDYELGLLGHSDADVLLHALCDAILGALGAGDIGKHFPDSDPAYKGIDSFKLLQQVVALAREQGYVVSNCDVTVIAQRPKLAPYVAAMVDRVAAGCGIATGQVNIKATTTETLGFEGRGEGISAHAVVLLAVASQNL
ncbi:MAG: 2-C-methyl-D-erythritol 2,4-cyclodiphosphate synthase [Desulfuromonas sp.]|nr:MAG: 2-C-methyl-D-erythritol 2,4-cyclodiphosphate synthase [Desulfuromonas sp.]